MTADTLAMKFSTRNIMAIRLALQGKQGAKGSNPSRVTRSLPMSTAPRGQKRAYAPNSLPPIVMWYSAPAEGTAVRTLKAHGRGLQSRTR